LPELREGQLDRELTPTNRKEHHMKRNRFIAAAAALLALGIMSAAPALADPPPNIIVGTYGDDVLVGTFHKDFIAGLSGDDVLVGARHDDVLRGGRGDDILRDFRPEGHSGSDLLRGGPGRDRCVGDASDMFAPSCERVIVRG
jgi:Ca2+-binding RTX toxin-like protein